jgi:hypothetical protein
VLESFKQYGDGKYYDPIVSFNAKDCDIEEYRLNISFFERARGFLFRSVFNPVDYNGTWLR